MSIHILSRTRIEIEVNVTVGFCLGLALAMGFHPKLCSLLSRLALILSRICQRCSQFQPMKRCCLETEEELELQHCFVRDDSKSLCSRLDRFLSCFESILLHESPLHREAACTLSMSVAFVVLLLFQEFFKVLFSFDKPQTRIRTQFG